MMITPYSFDIGTCRSIVGDVKSRELESDARACAESESIRASNDMLFMSSGTTYFDSVQQYMRYIVWLEAYEKRVARLGRLKGPK